jgi:hypothetical protein
MQASSYAGTCFYAYPLSTELRMLQLQRRGRGELGDFVMNQLLTEPAELPIAII